MKLIKEITEDVQYLQEEKDGKKSTFIEGVFLQSEIKKQKRKTLSKRDNAT